VIPNDRRRPRQREIGVMQIHDLEVAIREVDAVCAA
jgi:hypothetical protein